MRGEREACRCFEVGTPPNTSNPPTPQLDKSFDIWGTSEVRLHPSCLAPAPLSHANSDSVVRRVLAVCRCHGYGLFTPLAPHEGARGGGAFSALLKTSVK